MIWSWIFPFLFHSTYNFIIYFSRFYKMLEPSSKVKNTIPWSTNSRWRIRNWWTQSLWCWPIRVYLVKSFYVFPTCRTVRFRPISPKATPSTTFTGAIWSTGVWNIRNISTSASSIPKDRSCYGYLIRKSIRNDEPPTLSIRIAWPSPNMSTRRNHQRNSRKVHNSPHTMNCECDFGASSSIL